MRRPRAPATMVHSLSCTDLDWERVREWADAAGLSPRRGQLTAVPVPWPRARRPRPVARDYASSRPPDSRSLTRSRSIPEGRNTTTRRGEIGAGSPVLGFRPKRDSLSRRQEIAEPRDPHRFPRYQLFADRLDHRVDQPADSRRDNPHLMNGIPQIDLRKCRHRAISPRLAETFRFGVSLRS